MTALLPTRSKHALVALVAALIVLAFVLLAALRGQPAASTGSRRQRVEATRRDLQPLLDELRNE